MIQAMAKVIYPKYYPLWQLQLIVDVQSILTQKVHFKAKIDIFFTFTLIKLSVRMLQFAQTLFCTFLVHENMKKYPLN